MNTIKLLIILYSINLFKNLFDFNKVFKSNDEQNYNTTLQGMYIIKFFILSLFQILIIYLLFKEADFEAKPLILISYGIAIPLYTIDYMNKLYNESLTHLDYIKNISLFLLQCITSTLAIYLIWSKKTKVSATILLITTLLIMFLPLVFLYKNNNLGCQQNSSHQPYILPEEHNILSEEHNILAEEHNILPEEHIMNNHLDKITKILNNPNQNDSIIKEENYKC